MEDAVAAPMAEESKKDVKLEDLFADEDSDDEFPSSRPQDEPTSSAPEGGAISSVRDSKHPSLEKAADIP